MSEEVLPPSPSGVGITHTSPYFSQTGSSVRDDRSPRTPGKQRSSGMAISLILRPGTADSSRAARGST